MIEELYKLLSVTLLSKAVALKLSVTVETWKSVMNTAEPLPKITRVH
jgi:hypothetical protein